jgi:tetratricopeptide (TPR) repeat protein
VPATFARRLLPSRTLRSIATIAAGFALALIATDVSIADSSHAAPRPGDPGMSLPPASMLVECYERFLKGHDIEAFRVAIAARYTDGTLSRLTQSTDVRARRASVLALGLNGDFGCNAAVAKTLKDSDPTVRSLAANALWAIWSRADNAENNAALEAVQSLIERGRFEDSIKKANALIARAPTFAEAHNQRAIAHYLTGRLAESAEDCRRVLELNPYHFGALSGLGQCQLRLGQRAEAIRTFRRALDLQPFSDGLRETVAELEAAED